MGIDPGSHRAGYGLVAHSDRGSRHIHHGIIQLETRAPLVERLVMLHYELMRVYAEYTVDSTSLEKVFFGKNASSAFVLGHARGVCLLATGQAKVPVFEYAAKYVKKCVTGSGAATKEHVQLIVFNLLGVKIVPGARATAFDASDALSLALTHARVEETSLALSVAGRRQIEAPF